MAAVRRARPRCEAVDPDRLPLGSGPIGGQVRHARGRGRQRRADRGLARRPGRRSGAAPHQPHPEQIADDPRRDHGAGAQALRPAIQPGARRREAEGGYDATSFDFYSPEEVHALVRSAASAQDATLFLTAAFTGLRRGELVALRWRDVDFERSAVRVAGSYANGKLTTPKSGHGRVVPMVPKVAGALARLGQRSTSVGDDDLVFPGEFGVYLDGSALRRRFVAACARAGLRPIRFHDLRHTFGTLAVRGAESTVELQNWLGHAEVRTTMRYTHYREQQDAAARLAAAFRTDQGTATNAPPVTDHDS